jgi:hypothetical protein
MQFMVPKSGHSPTSAAGLMDAVDDHIYSAGVFADGATQPLSLFSVPQGQNIATSKAAAMVDTTWPTHYKGAMTELHTSMEQAGQLGQSQGDASIRAIGVTLDPAAITYSTGASAAYGATPFEVADLCSKVWFELTITRKRKSMGPLFLYPNLGTAAFAGPSTTFNASVQGYAQNGFGGGRKLKVAIGIAKTDTPIAKFTPGAALAFRTASVGTVGQPVLFWCTLFANVAREVR